MKKSNKLWVLLLVMLGSVSLSAQVGIKTSNPLATLHVDGASDNSATGKPNASQESNDVVVTPTGQLGVGIISPTVKLHVVGTTANSNRFSLIDAPAGTNQHVALALRNVSPLATGNYSLLGFTNNGPSGGGAAWGIGSIRTGNTSVSGNEEEFYVGNSLGGTYNERMRINVQGNVGIGTSQPHQNAILELSSTTKGFLPTRLTTAQRDAITPKPEGLMIYNLDIHCMQYWNATKWVGDCDGGTPDNNNTITDCRTAGYSGTFQQGVSVSSSTINIKVNVTQTGPWSITSNTVNGVTFSGSGNFTATGVQTVTVTGNGTPINSGTFNYTFTLGSSTCSRDVNYSAQDPAIDPCQTVWLGRSNFPNTYLVNGQSVAVSVSTTGYVTAGSQMDSCGGHSTSNSWKIGTYNSPGSITFTFSKPVSNVKINANGWYSGANNVATVTARNGAIIISNPTLLTSQSCNQVPTVTGNTITQPGTFAVQNTVTSITVSYNGVSNGSPFPAGGLLHISFCDSAQ